MAKTSAATPETVVSPPPTHGGLIIPKWALLSGSIMILIAAAMFVTHDSRKTSSLVSLLNNAFFDVSTVEDGLADGYGEIRVKTNEKAVTDVLGLCQADAPLALRVFNDLLQGGKTSGRMIACRIGFSLIQDSKLSATDADKVFSEMRALIGKENDPKLRRVAQFWVSQLVGLAPVDAKDAFEELKAPELTKGEDKDTGKEKSEKKTEDKISYKVSTSTIELDDGKILDISWASPEAFQLWWEKFGAKAQWDPQVKRFMIRK